LLAIANKIKLLGSDFADSKIVEKSLVTLLEKYKASIASLENTKNLSRITFAEVIHAFQAQEQRRLMRDDHVVEGALLAKSQANNYKNHSTNSQNNANNYNNKNSEKKRYPPCQHCDKMSHPSFRC